MSMAQILISESLKEELESIAAENFRTVELQLKFWISQAGGTVAMPVDKPKRIRIVRKKVAWTPEKREEQRQRMEALWKSGRINRPAKNDFDQAAQGRYDD
jgi:hypothetical protein